MVSMGTMSGHDTRSIGQYLLKFDPDAFGGRGLVDWTPDKARAIRFASMEEAAVCWRRQSARVPLRDDGRPNRPLTAYSITFEIVEE
jgi:hypothetical protein